jgi:hypothetical protein
MACRFAVDTDSQNTIHQAASRVGALCGSDYRRFEQSEAAVAPSWAYWANEAMHDATLLSSRSASSLKCRSRSCTLLLDLWSALPKSLSRRLLTTQFAALIVHSWRAVRPIAILLGLAKCPNHCRAY